MQRMQRYTDCLRRQLLQVAIAVTAVVFCTVAPMLSGSSRFPGNETNSPFEQEDNRESAEEPSGFLAGRNQLRWKSDQYTRRGDSAQVALRDNRRQHCFVDCFNGHRLANGLMAPLAC